MKNYVFGVDVGGTTVKIGLFKTEGTLVTVWEIPTRTEENGKYILADIAAAIQEKMAEVKLSAEDVEGIGLGVPGPVGDNGIVYKCVNLGWDIFNVADELYGLTGFTVKAGNDANVAALGEMWKGGGEGYQDVVMVTLGTGVGGVSKAGEIVLETVKKHYKKAAFHASRDTKFALAKLGNNAGIYGSARLVLNQ